MERVHENLMNWLFTSILTFRMEQNLRTYILKTNYGIFRWLNRIGL